MIFFCPQNIPMAALLTTDDLYHGTSLAHLDFEVNEIYKTIAIKIRAESKAGGSQIVFDLPDIFNTNVDQEDAQLYIYSQLIERLEKGKFTVTLLKKNKDLSLRVKWKSILEPKDRTRMFEVIKSHIERPL
jgi:hypothetical protein